MVTTKVKICLQLVLFILISSCQADDGDGMNRKDDDDDASDNLIPLLLLLKISGAVSVATPAVSLLSTLSLAVLYLFGYE